MGKTGENSWLNVVKRAFRSPVKDNEKKYSRRGEHEQDEEEKKRGKGRWILWKSSLQETTIQHIEGKNKASPISTTSTSNGGNVLKKPLSANADSEQRRAIAVAMATTAAAEAAVATAQAAVEIIRLTRPSILDQQRNAAIVIQTIFRGYLARKALRALKGIVMLQSLIRGYSVRKRAKMTLQCMQSLFRVQTRVCDQRRRLSCEGSRNSIFIEPSNRGETCISSRKSISRNVSSTSDDFDERHACRPEEIRALIQKAKEFSLKQGKTLAHALTQQNWNVDGNQFPGNNGSELENARLSGRTTKNQWNRSDTNLCKDVIKTVQIDNDRTCSNRSSNFHNLHDQYHQDYPSPLHRKCNDFSLRSPNMSSSYNTKSAHAHSVSPRYQRLERKYQAAETPTLRSNYFHRMSTSRNSAPASQPNYMATTASAEARVGSQSAPRHRPSNPEREKISSVKKRLSFPVPDHCSDIGLNGYTSDHHNIDTSCYKNIIHMVPSCVEQRSIMSSCCTDSLADDISSSTTCDTRWLR